MGRAKFSSTKIFMIHCRSNSIVCDGVTSIYFCDAFQIIVIRSTHLHFADSKCGIC